MDITLCLASRDDELLTAVADGDHDAFAELYDRFAPHVYARANGLSADAKQAHGIVLDVFLDFWRQAPRLDRAKTDVATWMFATPHLRR